MPSDPRVKEQGSSTETLAALRDRLSDLTYNDYLRHLRSVEAATEGGIPLRVAILRSYTVEPIEPILDLRLRLDRYRPSFWFGGFNQYAQEAFATDGPLQSFGPDLVLLLIRIEETMPDFVEQYPSMTAAQWEARVDARVRDVAGIVERLVNTLSASVIVQNATLARPYFGLHDSQTREGQQRLIQSFNHNLAGALEGVHGAFIWDFDRLARAKGLDNLYDRKLWYISRNPFKQSMYPAIVDDLYRYVRSALGPTKKCVVVDLDNTLWGGIVGEDGFEGIQIGNAYPGNCYRDFQKELLRLHDRGILLAINSKNNEEDVQRIFDEHPDMVLRRRHFAAVRINWQDKASNLRELASQLNIGLDSMVFVDDSPLECELIRRECPECEVVQLPDKPYELPDAVARMAGVENIRLTEEDRQKGAMYQAQEARRELLERNTNIADFLESLDMVVEVEPATPFSIPRIAQLTQKTNQWNMTTRRYTEAQIQAMSADSGHAVLAVASSDRFGREGIVGVCILKFGQEECLIDTFLLSCRVIGRGIEELMMAYVAELAVVRGMRRLVGEFLPTKKNRPAERFYEKAGLTRTGDTMFQADLKQTTFAFPAHIRMTVSKGSS